MKAVKVYGDWEIHVEFDDGHSATFEPYAHGFGYGIEGLRRFILSKGDQLVFQYDARLYRAEPQTDEEQVVFAANGYAQQLAAEYWNEAKRFADSLFRPGGWDNDSPSDGRYRLAWKVIGEGWIGLSNLKDGNAKEGQK
ncbi:MAG: hypothetical protein A2W25_12310 [candidate division Zixibacteria bacterium RBG_16_53_22]|nr:MAG: hypothetical protein A2W25_12310 [candidate division Zixibacteria bacterium RBG_16_53_22]